MAKPIQFAQRPAAPQPSEPQAVGVVDFATLRDSFSGVDEKRLAEVVEMICCVVGAKATVAGQVTGLVNRPSGVPFLRNLLALMEILGTLRFETLSSFARELGTVEEDRTRQEPPSFWQLLRSAGHPDVRRGLGFLLSATGALGRAVR
jgi:uncharacterized protein YjgD (DUF1641 family)